MTCGTSGFTASVRISGSFGNSALGISNFDTSSFGTSGFINAVVSVPAFCAANFGVAAFGGSVVGPSEFCSCDFAVCDFGAACSGASVVLLTWTATCSENRKLLSIYGYSCWHIPYASTWSKEIRNMMYSVGPACGRWGMNGVGGVTS